MKSAGQTDAARGQIQRLIDTTNMLISDYERYNQGVDVRGAPSIYSPAIAAVIAWFYSQGYYLSAELLTHANDNYDVNSEYYPIYGSRVNGSPVTIAIRNSPDLSGDDLFPNSGNTIQRDLYYAIHRFNWYKSGGELRIYDLYNFERGDYEGIAGIAIDTMYLAQQAGTLVPYWTLIRV